MLVINVMSGVATALFVEGYEFARAVATGVETGATAMSEAPIEDGNPVLIMVCPEDLIAMREKGAPREVLEHAEALLESKIARGRDVLLELSPS